MTDWLVPATRRAGRLLGLFVGLILVFVLAMTAVYALPQVRIVENLQASMGTLDAEGLSPQPLADSAGYTLYNYTDALMLDTSIVTRSGSPLLKAMADDHGEAGGIQTGGASDLPGRLPMPVNTITALAASAAGHRGPASAYAYYWHGYQVVLRPALLFFTYADIRWLNMLGLALLSFIVLITMDRFAGWEATAAFFFSLVLVGSFVVPLSLAFSPDFYVMLTAMLAVLLLAKRECFCRVDMEIFLVAGMLTAFLDLLTAPLLTLGMPLVVVFIMLGRSGRVQRFVRNVALAIKLSAVWVLGYAAAWMAKWYIGSAVLHINVAQMAWAEFLFRVGARQDFRPLQGLVANIAVLAKGLLMEHPTRHDAVLLIPVLAVIVVAIWMLVRYRRPHEAVISTLPVLLVVPLPYLFFLVANQASVNNQSFGYRMQAMAVFAILYAVLASIDWRAAITRIRNAVSGYHSGSSGG